MLTPLRLAVRSSGRRSGARWRTWTTDSVWTGTALGAVRGLPAITILLLLLQVPGFPGAAAADWGVAVADRAPPGAIGARGRLQPGPCPEESLGPGSQPVEITGPEGMLVAIETAEGWSPLRPAPLRLALVVNRPYRLRIGGIERREGDEVFPSIRVLARLATPPGTAWRFPVAIAIDADDLTAALAGCHVRRVVYASCESDQANVVAAGWFDVKPGDDALEVARTLGDPVAEIVIGNRLPTPGLTP